MAHAILILLAASLVQVQKAGITGVIFYAQEWIILGSSVLLGIVCALIPAVQAYRTDIPAVLARS
jgi:putative ABC transport system permease protein